MSETAKIYELPKATLAHVPNVLRALADAMESGQYGAIRSLAMVSEGEDGAIRTFGAGGADYYHAIALFQLGIADLVNQRMKP